MRLAIMFDPPRPVTPGELARQCGVDPDHIGVIWIHADGSTASVDVQTDHGREARRNLEEWGPVQLEKRDPKQKRPACVRISLGRNHGFTLPALQKTLAKLKVAKHGRIEVGNGSSIIHGSEAECEDVVDKLEGKRANGYLIRADYFTPKLDKPRPERKPR
jgi:hypothetical protein